jgi:hypothetical protein
MAASLRQQIKFQAAQIALCEIAIRCLFATHPSPARLRAAFESAGPRFLEHALASDLTDEDHADVEELYRTFSAMIDIADRDQ